MRMQAWGSSDKGLKREGNQDSYLIDDRLGVFIVADGVGGHFGGEVASALAVETVREVVNHPKAAEFRPREVLAQAYEEASHRIFDRATQEPKLNGMGTTMVMSYVRDNKIYIANVGDSRCYLYRKPFLWQLTEDHSLINEQVRLGMMTEEQAKKMIGKNVITRSVGFERDVFPDVIEREISSGDIFLFCSDGLSGMVPDNELCSIFNLNPVDKVVPIMIKKALDHGGDDNVTVLVLNFHDV
ncbi:protein phosphatase [Pseudobdellovibrio exovorus JSS]|uniref:Protein phosphatase n=2 Tax=Pseudobdellovibrio exovorus TaxID=453816 RepID=M4VT95_9BACT|nr:protein phosphatase [Pseudobdellovibrio exovorus JSS]